jgi:Protein of unknown function (DUF3551)
VKISTCRLAIAVAGCTVAVAFHTPANALTIGNAPWCAVANQGGGNIVWDCEYVTFDQCLPNVLGGNGGFCQHNPYWQGGYSAAPSGKRHRHQY